MIRKLFYLSAIILFIRCETNPPSTPEEIETEFGKVFISANTPDAAIFLNDVNTRTLTPDTIQAPVGTNTIRLEKEGYASLTHQLTVVKDSIINVDLSLQEVVSKIVLLEDFANVSCTPCVTSNKVIEQLVNKTYGTNKLIAV